MSLFLSQDAIVVILTTQTQQLTMKLRLNG